MHRADGLSWVPLSHAGQVGRRGPCRAGGVQAGGAPWVMLGRWGPVDEGPCRAGGVPKMKGHAGQVGHYR